jgi:ABC-type transport system involved in cytochrome c biogenesis permease subunit
MAGFARLLMLGKSEWWLLVLAAHVPAILGGAFIYTLTGGEAAALDAASMRILWQLMKGLIAGLVLLAGCRMVFKKRAGVVLLHFGIALMMFSELQVSLTAVEGQMMIEEGQAVNFVQDIRTVELAVIDRSDPKSVYNIVVPASMLESHAVSQQVIRHKDLPFDVKVVQFLQNSTIHDVTPGDKNPADAGAGLKSIVKPAKPGTGTDSNSAVDVRSAYVQLIDKQSGKPIGTYLTSIYLNPQSVSVGEESFDIALRFKRTYKQYTMLLNDVRQETYAGTSMARDYSSYVRLVDPGREVDREIRIWMNNPLRFAGETFYQSNFSRQRVTQRDPVTGMVRPVLVVDPETGQRKPKFRESTTLSVVTNTGWMIPYVSCMIVATGLLAHFLGVLVRFLNRREKEQRSGRPVFDADGLLQPTEPAGTATTPQVKAARKLSKAKKAKVTQAKKGPQPAVNASLESDKSLLSWMVPLAVVLLCAAWIGSKVRTPAPATDKMNLYEFGKIPVLYKGRQKPLDTLARNSLRVISDKQTFMARLSEPELKKNWDDIVRAVRKKWKKLSESDLKSVDYDVDQLIKLIQVQTGGNREEIVSFVDGLTTSRQPAIRWLLDVMARPSVAQQHKIFRVENLEVLETLGLKRRKGFRYAVEEFREKAEELETQARLAKKIRQEAPEDLSIYQRKILDFDQRVRTFTLLAETLRPPPLPDLPDSGEYISDREGTTAAYLKFQRVLMAAKARQAELKDYSPPFIVPVEKDLRHDDEMSDREEWETYATAWMNDVVRVQIFRKDANPSTLALNAILVAYTLGEAKTFNNKVEQYQSALQSAPPEELIVARINYEAFFSHFAPFFYSIWLYLLAFVLACLAWLGWNRPLNNASSSLIVFTLALHTFALVSRIYISGRPPVTNLYASAVFIGWGCVILGLVVEAIYRIGIGNIISTVAGFATLWIAHLLAGDGDTFAKLQAVLDTQFWLATHVTCITLGYATTFVAGMLGLLYVLRGVATPSLSKEIGRDLGRMIYGTLCFAIFFSFVGTVLGGLWADDSWGRFWGWDPKENGALIIVLWNVLVLHARWGGMVKERGLAVLAIGGNIVTSWSWFGVNELGVGLHAYGFTEGVLLALMVFVVSQLAVIAIGCLPKDLWWSFRERQSDRTDA